MIHRASLDFDPIVGERMADVTLPEYPLFEVTEMLKHSLQHPDHEIRTTSQHILQLLNDKHGFATIEGVAMQLHP